MAKQYYGYNPPFFGGQQNVLSRQAGDRLIKNDLLQLLLTIKGERVMRPNWGTDIKTSLFEAADSVLITALEDDIREVIRTYETRIEPTNINISATEDENILQIKIQGYYTNEPNRTFQIEVALPFSAAV